MDRVDLSAHTRIEMVDGVWYLITENLTVAIDWPEKHTEGGPSNPDSAEWFEMGLDEDWGASVIWRIPLTAVAPAYEYRVGEPWAASHNEMITCGPPDAMTIPYTFDGEIALHRRATMVCDTAEQFRALHAALMEVSDE